MNNTTQAKLTYALKDGHMVNVDDVATGNACECICPYCHGNLCAKNTSDEIAHHFAHISGEECDGAYESALHILAKEILEEDKCLKLPDKSKIYFQKVSVEKTDEQTNLRPDCIGILDKREIWVEFAYSHKAEPKKITSLVSKKIECIEIDISECSLDKKVLRDFIENSSKNRMWLYSQMYSIGNTKQPESNVYNKGEGRHCAINNMGKVIDIYKSDLVHQYDFELNPCHCICCGEPVLLSMDPFGGYQFTHSSVHPSCNDEDYLSTLAKLVFYNRFKRDGSLQLSLPIRKRCPKYKDCPYKNEKYCLEYKKEDYNLKVEKNDIEETPTLDVQFENLKDIVIAKGKSKIRFFFKISTNSHNRESKEKIITINVRNESQALEIDKIKFDSDNKYTLFQNFEWQAKESMNRNHCNVFVGYSTHRYGLVKIKCPAIPRIESEHSIAVLIKIIFNNDVNEEYCEIYGLLYCLQNNIKVCPCYLCKHFDKEADKCLCHEEKGTPQYPLDCNQLDSFIIECPFFEILEEFKTLDISSTIRRIINYSPR